MLYNLKNMLAVAKKYHFAIGAFNTSDLALVRAVVEQAEATDTPAILQFAPGEFRYATPYFFQYVIPRLKDSRVAFARTGPRKEHGGMRRCNPRGIYLCDV